MAQGAFVVDGIVTNSKTGKALPRVTVSVGELLSDSLANAITDKRGYYSLNLSEGHYKIVYSNVGYKDAKHEVIIRGDTTIHVNLTVSAIVLDDVDIELSQDLTGRKTMSIEKIKSIPALAGEVDVIRVFQMLPGVQTVSEGNTGLYVRGGNADQTLIQFDGATIYNPSHVYGFLSVFNPEVVKDAVLYKGHIPARYGGRLSSVLEVNTSDGSVDSFAMSGGIGLISSRLKLETPIIKDKLSFTLTGRRSYADLVVKSFLRRYENTSLFFYDTNAKLMYTPNDNNKISVSAYRGRDNIDIDTNLKFAQRWGNDAYTFQWNATVNERLSVDFSAHSSSFISELDFDNNSTASYLWETAIHDRNAAIAANYTFGSTSLALGAELSSYKVPPGEIDYFRNDDAENESDKLDTKRAVLPAVYVSGQGNLTKALSIEAGIRYSGYTHTGPSRVFTYEKNTPELDENIVDTLLFNRGEVIQRYQNIEPRIALQYEIDRRNRIKFFYNRTSQYLQTVSNFAAGVPYERWIAADRYIQPQVGDQIGLSYFKTVDNQMVSISLETYYRWMYNQIDLKNDALILSKNNLETELLAGSAMAYGAELLVEKHGEPWNGWVGYTWAKVLRQIDGINSSQPYYPTFDRRHNLTAFTSYAINNRVSISVNWVFASGQATTFPEGITEIEGIKLLYYDERKRNQHRLPDYHRMDLSVTLDGRKNEKRRWRSSWNFSLYNVYARKNPYLITFAHPRGDGLTVTEIDTNYQLAINEYRPIMIYLFSIIPSATYNFKF